MKKSKKKNNKIDINDPWTRKLLPEHIVAKVLNLATRIITTGTFEQDRWGGQCGVDIYALRFGSKCLLLSHFPDIGDPDSPPETDIEKWVPLEEAVQQATEVFKGYYESYEPLVTVEPGRLPDKKRALDALLDKHRTLKAKLQALGG